MNECTHLMSVHTIPVPGPGYETRDASVPGLLKFGVGLIVALIVVQLLMLGFYRLFVSERPKAPGRKHRPTSTSSCATSAATRRRRSASYGWVDRKAGIVRIPIDRAIELVAEKGIRFGKGPKTELEMNSHAGTPVVVPAAELRTPRDRRRARDRSHEDDALAFAVLVLLAASLTPRREHARGRATAARNVGRGARDVPEGQVRPEPRRAAATRRAAARRAGANGQARRLLRPPAGDREPGLLRVPDALQRGAQLALAVAQRADVRRRQGVRSGHGEHRPQRDAGPGRAEEGGLPEAATAARGPTRGGTS